VSVARHLAAIEKMTAMQLRAKYAELFGDESRSKNRQWLLRRCAWRIQALAEGDLSERARQRAEELARDCDLRSIPPAEMNMAPPRQSTPEEPVRVARTYIRPPLDARLPIPGQMIKREYHGREYIVEVLDRGFLCENKLYQSLSAVAHAITGNHWNGFLFFGLTRPRKETT
jgi:hypothetical protein